MTIDEKINYLLTEKRIHFRTTWEPILDYVKKNKCDIDVGNIREVLGINMYEIIDILNENSKSKRHIITSLESEFRDNEILNKDTPYFRYSLGRNAHPELINCTANLVYTEVFITINEFKKWIRRNWKDLDFDVFKDVSDVDEPKEAKPAGNDLEWDGLIAVVEALRRKGLTRAAVAKELKDNHGCSWAVVGALLHPGGEIADFTKYGEGLYKGTRKDVPWKNTKVEG